MNEFTVGERELILQALFKKPEVIKRILEGSQIIRVDGTRHPEVFEVFFYGTTPGLSVIEVGIDLLDL
ncbi:MAG: hypothetical protein GTN93_29015 [Anaerolineae bacterium]|nr:hypothetical protein [Anaerolineae bacterium]NIQ82047.1 hypothetical protein [Anaerolineae bacterium]